MTTAVNKHLKEAEQKKGRITSLEQSIKENESRLIDIRESYKSAVVNDDKNIDDLFHEMELLQGKLKADKHKLETLRSVTNEHLRKDALKTLESYQSDTKPKFDAKAKEIMDKVEQAKKDYIQAVSGLRLEGIQLNREFKNESGGYWKLVNKYNFDSREVDAVANSLFFQLESNHYGTGHFPFKDNLEVTSQFIQKEMDEQ